MTLDRSHLLARNAIAARATRRPMLGFGVLHAANTALNMGFTLLQLLVLARILPMARYSEVVFLMSVGFYFQPFDQAFGKANFVALRGASARSPSRRTRPELAVVLAGQAGVLLLACVAIPSGLAAAGSSAWVEDVLFLFLCLSINFWAFDLQSTAWSMDLNLPFVRLSIVHRTLHVGALLAAYATTSFLMFGALATAATLGCLAVAARLLGRAGLFAKPERPADWRSYAAIFRTSFLSTLADFLVMNAPYALITARFGIGPMLIVFDSVMKLARIVLAGSRTLAEIALPRHSRLLEGGDRRSGRRLFWLVVALSCGASLVPSLAVAFGGHAVFSLLLGANNVVPAAAMAPAALVILACSLYQPAVFFLGYGNERSAVQTLTLAASAALLGFAAALWGLELSPGSTLALYGVLLIGLASLAAWFTDGLFSAPGSIGTAEAAVMLQTEQAELP